jgi:hypothetical protein
VKYLSVQRLSTITIQDRATFSFVVPVELAVIVFWFLASRPARLIAVLAWSVCQSAAGWWLAVTDLKGWRADLELIRLAILDLFGVNVVYALG